MEEKEKDEVLELGTRKRIYETVRKNPGVHMRELERLTGFSVALVKYHLGQLEKHDLITFMDEGGYRRYYIQGSDLPLTVAQRRTLGVLRREIPLRIVLFLIRNPYSKHKDIHEALGLAPSTLSFHLNRLVKEGIVVQAEEDTDEGEGRRRSGYVVSDLKGTVRILVTYRPLFDKMADSFTDLWTEIHR